MENGLFMGPSCLHSLSNICGKGVFGKQLNQIVSFTGLIFLYTRWCSYTFSVAHLSAQGVKLCDWHLLIRVFRALVEASMPSEVENNSNYNSINSLPQNCFFFFLLHGTDLEIKLNLQLLENQPLNSCETRERITFQN